MEARIETGRGNLWHAALSSFWFGSFFLWIPLTTVLLQDRVDHLIPQHGLQNTGVGIAAGVGGILAVTVPPLVGAWSDRLNTRYGRRRPIIVLGTLLTLPGLFLIMAASSYPELLVGYAIVQFFFNAAGAAYAGVVPDVVPAQQFGKASGFLGTMTLLGIGAGTGVTSILGDVPLMYVIIAIVVLVSLGPMLWAAQLEGRAPVYRSPAKPFGFFGGLMSDRLHRRKIFVYGAGAAQSLVAVVFILFYPSAQPLVIALAVAYGVGYGLY